MKVISINGKVFIGEFAEGKLTNASGIQTKDITDNVARFFDDFLCKEHMGLLVNMTVGSNDSVMERDFYEEEEIAMTGKRANFAIAEVRAVKALVADFYKANF